MAEESIKKVQITTLGLPADMPAEGNENIEAPALVVNPFEASAEQALASLKASKAPANLFGTNPIQTREVDLSSAQTEAGEQTSTSFSGIFATGFKSVYNTLGNAWAQVNKINNSIDGKRVADIITPSYEDLYVASSMPRVQYLARQLNAEYYGS